MRDEIPSPKYICQANQKLINIVANALQQIMCIESKFTNSYEKCHQYTAKQQHIIFVISSQKMILESRLRKEQAKMPYLSSYAE
jgi:hypothetical protein